jgi:DNA-binding MarR family transcriptional regulator
MRGLDRKAKDLRDVVQEIMFQFRVVDGACANGPHADLSTQELRLLEYLGDRGPRMMRELAEFLLLAVNSVTSTVDNMEQKGLVRRQRSDEDRRVVQVELTDQGRAVYDNAVVAKLRFLRCLLAARREEEQEIYMVLMRKIARAGQTQLQQLTAMA